MSPAFFLKNEILQNFETHLALDRISVKQLPRRSRDQSYFWGLPVNYRRSGPGFTGDRKPYSCRTRNPHLPPEPRTNRGSAPHQDRACHCPLPASTAAGCNKAPQVGEHGVIGKPPSELSCWDLFSIYTVAALQLQQHRRQEQRPRSSTGLLPAWSTFWLRLLFHYFQPMQDIFYFISYLPSPGGLFIHREFTLKDLSANFHVRCCLVQGKEILFIDLFNSQMLF